MASSSAPTYYFNSDIYISVITSSSSVLHAIFNKDNLFLEMSIVMSMWGNPYLELEDV